MLVSRDVFQRRAAPHFMLFSHILPDCGLTACPPIFMCVEAHRKFGSPAATAFPAIASQVAGCGFKGCSGSLVRPPSFSDEDIMTDGYRSSAPPAFPPLGGAGGSKGGVDFGASPAAAMISSKLRLSFRWRSPANTFDNEEDSTDYDDNEDVDGSSPRVW